VNRPGYLDGIAAGGQVVSIQIQIAADLNVA